MALFTALIVGHVIVGTVALISFWVPVVTAKGGAAHRKWGRIFHYAVCIAAWFAIAMALLNLTFADDRHPTLTDRELFEGLFGWMMLYLGVLTLGLTTYGMGQAQICRTGGEMQRLWHLPIQAAVFVAASVCAIDGMLLGQPLMIALALLGIGTAVTFVLAIVRPRPDRGTATGEHLKAMVGAGIAAYTAFLSVGLLQLFPAYVFNPIVWSVPSLVGVAIILFQIRALRAKITAKPPSAPAPVRTSTSNR
jgi:hypothetical protein